MRTSILATVCAVGLTLAGNALAESALKVLGQDYDFPNKIENTSM